VLAAELGAGRHRLTSFRRETPTAIATSERQPADLLAA
jgi:S-adenosylmethionine decarboxylase